MIKKYILVLSLILIGLTTLNARDVRFKIPEEKKLAFNDLREQLMFRPYNSDLVRVLLKFNERIHTSAYKDKEMKSLLMFLLTNTKSKDLIEELKEAIWNPTIQTKAEIDKIMELRHKKQGFRGLKLLNKEKELAKYRSKFSKSYQTLLFYRINGDVEKEKELRKSLERNPKSFNPRKEDLIYYKMAYYLSIGDLSETEYTFSTIERELNGSMKRVTQQLEKNKQKKKNQKGKRVRRSFQEKEVKVINLRNVYHSYIAAMGSFMYSKLNDPNAEELIAKYAKVSKSINPSKPHSYYYYQMYQYNLQYKEYNTAIEYLSYLEKVDTYKDIDIEMFAILTVGAYYDYKANNFKSAWLNSKYGIVRGVSLDYKKYYKTVIELKRILRKSGLEYVRQLVQINDRDTALTTIEETNRIMRIKR